jgi:hypothetical protein
LSATYCSNLSDTVTIDVLSVSSDDLIMVFIDYETFIEDMDVLGKFMRSFGLIADDQSNSSKDSSKARVWN